MKTSFLLIPNEVNNNIFVVFLHKKIEMPKEP